LFFTATNCTAPNPPVAHMATRARLGIFALAPDCAHRFSKPHSELVMALSDMVVGDRFKLEVPSSPAQTIRPLLTPNVELLRLLSCSCSKAFSSAIAFDSKAI